ncbi:glycosyltransferase family 2 protein [Nakamurella sp.]|uniref:glycosyltransferase family 2 protein n=1 Tax=Nakamurella sp. TaxID=1869182 RepID=UPI003B3AF598
MPRFTVICPTYNRGPAIAATIESVRRQTVRDWELLVVSDASDDGTDDVVARIAARDRRVRLLRTRRFGFQAGPTNVALSRARGPIVAYLDHDDRWRPHHLATLAAEFDRGAEFVATRVHKVTADGTPVGTAHPLTMLWHPELQLMNPLFENSCAAHLTALAERVGGWRESEIGLEDWDLWVRLADAGIRCRTTLEVTVDMLENPGTRQHRLPCRYGHELARLPDARAARRAYRSLTDTRHREAATRACTADLTAWYGGLARTGELVYPSGWTGGASALPAAIESHLAQVGSVWRNLVLDPQPDGRVALTIVLGTMTADHAERYVAVFGRRMPHQQAFFDRVLAGRAAAVPAAGPGRRAPGRPAGGEMRFPGSVLVGAGPDGTPGGR